MKLDDKLPRRSLEPGDTLVEQGAEGDDVFVLLDGVFQVEVDGEIVAEVGPGAISVSGRLSRAGLAPRPCGP